MAKCGWLIVKGDKIEFVNFDRHNSQTSKDRALAALRMAKKRGNDAVTEKLRDKRNKSVTREEKIIKAVAYGNAPVLSL